MALINGVDTSCVGASEAAVTSSRTCFRGDEHSDQQVFLSLLSSSEVEEVEPSISFPRCSRFLPAISPSQCFLRMWKMGSACNRDSCADQGRVLRFLPILANL